MDNEILLNELYEILLKLENKQDCQMLLEDLCTYNEIEQMAKRIKAAKMLRDGKTYSQVIAQTQISSATLSRISRCLRHGSGGYNKFLN